MLYANNQTTTAAVYGFGAMPTARYSLDGCTSATASAAVAKRRRRCTIVTRCVIVTALFVGAFVALMMCAIPTGSLSVGIDSVFGLDGLDPAAAAGLINTVRFNLTLRVASQSYGRRSCVDPGTYLEVAYRCAKLATTPASSSMLCAGPRKSAEQRLVATGTGVRVPGHLLNSLADEAREQRLTFGVTVRRSGDDGQTEDKWVASCGGRRVGGGSGGAACDGDYHSCSGPANNAAAAGLVI